MTCYLCDMNLLRASGQQWDCEGSGYQGACREDAALGWGSVCSGSGLEGTGCPGVVQTCKGPMARPELFRQLRAAGYSGPWFPDSYPIAAFDNAACSGGVPVCDSHKFLYRACGPNAQACDVFQDECNDPYFENPIFESCSDEWSEWEFQYSECDWGAKQVREVWRRSNPCGRLEYQYRNQRTVPGECGAPQPCTPNWHMVNSECDWGAKQVREVWSDGCGNTEYRNQRIVPGECGAPNCDPDVWGSWSQVGSECDWDTHQVYEVWRRQNQCGEEQTERRNYHTVIGQCGAAVEHPPPSNVTLCDGVTMSSTELEAQLRAAGYGGPWDTPSMAAAYARANAWNNASCAGVVFPSIDWAKQLTTCDGLTFDKYSLAKALIAAGYSKAGPWDDDALQAAYKSANSTKAGCSTGGGGDDEVVTLCDGRALKLSQLASELAAKGYTGPQTKAAMLAAYKLYNKDKPGCASGSGGSPDNSLVMILGLAVAAGATLALVQGTKRKVLVVSK